MELKTYDEVESTALPAYCLDLRVFLFCEDDWPVVWVLWEKIVDAEK
jgi:hypothetical protein